MFKFIAIDAWVCTNPTEVPLDHTFSCQFIIGTNTHANRTSTSFDQVTSVVRIWAFGKTAEFAYKHLSKGALCYVEGEFAQRQYVNADGVQVTVAEVKADRIRLARTSNAAELVTHSEFIENLLDAWSQREAENPTT